VLGITEYASRRLFLIVESYYLCPAEPFAYHHDRKSRAVAAISGREDQPKREPTNVRSWALVTSTMAGLR
jgi:hypothetical protein